MKAELKAAVLATGSRLMDIHGIGPAGACTASKLMHGCLTWDFMKSATRPGNTR
jgi:hypothetical protein